MAERNGATSRTLQQNGEYGNQSVAHLHDALDADAPGDVIVLGVLPGGSTITDFRAVSEALGGLTNVDIGYRYINPDDGTDDTDFFVDGGDTSSPLIDIYTGAPVIIADGDGVEIVLTVGGANASGKIDTVISYIYNGC